MTSTLSLLLLLLAPAAAAGVDDPVPPDAIRTVLNMDGEVSDLKFEVADLGGTVADIHVDENDLEVRVDLSADVLFDFDKSTLKPEAKASLARAAAIIRERAAKGTVRIEGYTDAVGKPAYNLALSERRASSVRNALAKEAGPGVTFSVKGFGDTHPVAPNKKADGSDDPAGRAKNRRVEIVIAK